MSEKRVVGVNQCRRGTESDWIKAINFSPKDGEIIVYKPDENHVTPRFKVGDGITNVNDLPFSDAEGYNTIAGGKGFTIISASDNNDGTGTYTLSSVTGLEVGMRYSAVLSSANYNAGTITAINDNTVTVNGYKHIELNGNVDDPENFNVYNCFLIVDRPELGDKEVGFNAHAEGENTIASNKAAHAEGANTKAIGKFAHAEGNGTIAGHGAHAEGGSTQALGDLSHSEGNRTKATGNYSHTEGNNTVASAQGTHAEGIKAQAIYNAAHAEGQNTLADGLAAHAEGESTIAKFTGSHAEGVSTQAIEEAAHAEGYNTQATAKAAHAEGENTVASAKRAHTEGYGTTASGLNAHAEGKNTLAEGEEAHAEGIDTKASGGYAHAEGNLTQATGESAHAEGKETVAQGANAHAEGVKSQALKMASHAEGYNTEASGEKSHAEGNSTKATGTASHAEGDKTEAKGYASHAGGQNSIASNAASFVHGSGLKTNSNNQAVVGAYNKTFDNYPAAFIVGNGKEDARSNAFAVMKDGSAFVKGTLYVEGMPEGGGGSPEAVATETYVSTALDSMAASVKDDLLNGAGEAYDTLKELGDLIDENNDAIEALKTVATNKADKSNTVVTGSFSMGRKAGTDVGSNSFAVGTGVTATGTNSYAGGQDTVASGWHSHAEGHLTQATGYGAHAENGQTKAIGGYSHAEGYLSMAEGSHSHSEGQSTQAIGNNSHAEGQDTQATGDCSHAEGLLTVASGANSHAEGLQAQALSIATSATGLLTKAGGKAFKVIQRSEIPTQWGTYVGYTLNSIAGLQAALDAATAAGQPLYYAVHIADTDYYELGVVGQINPSLNTLVGGGYSNIYPMTDLEKTLIPSVGSHLLIAGYPQLGEIEIGAYATAEGVGSCAQHYAAHAEGISTYAIGPGAHAEGVVAHAVHIGSHAEGYHTVAGGAHSHAGGSESEASGENAFAHGEKVYAYGKNQTVFGQYNKEDPDALFIVGGGESEGNRKNLFTVKKDGSITGLNTSNALTKTVSGEAIAITDASPIEHEMGVKVRGKNLITPANIEYGYELVSAGGLKVPNSAWYVTGWIPVEPSTTYTISGTSSKYRAEVDADFAGAVSGAMPGGGTFTTTEKTRYVRLNSLIDGYEQPQLEEGTTATAYTPYIEDISTVKVKKIGKNILPYPYPSNPASPHTTNGITFTLNADGSIKIEGKATGNAYYLLWNADLGTSNMTGSSNGGTNGFYAFSPYMNYNAGNKNVSVYISNGTDLTTPITIYPQIEKGAIVTEYEPYIEPIEYPASADGTVEGVTPIYPTTTLMTDTAGAVMDCTYNRDINAAFAGSGFMSVENPSGTGSFSMNRKANTTIGEYSHAEGYNTTASGKYSHAEGRETTASTDYTHAEGGYTQAKAGYAHAQGYSSKALGRYSHAGGNNATANKEGSFAHGQSVTSDANYQTTIGTYNEVNANAAFVVGNGDSSSNKSNAFEVQKDGNIFVKGDLYIGGTGSTQASAKQVATKDSVSAMEQRINNLEDITSSTGGVFFEDADVAYVKTIPENVAPYASLNKVGGMGIYKKNLVNLIPSTYEADSGSVYNYHTFNSDAEGVITIIDRTPVEEWTYEPWFSGGIPLNTIELPAGMYTAAIYADNPEGSPFGLNIYGPGSGIDLRVGGAWGYDYAESPVTFVLTETTSLDLSLRFECGGSVWVPTGDTEVCHFRVMLNEGDEAMPWEPYSETTPVYVEPAKVSSIDIIGKNLLDYGESRAVESGSPGESETRLIIKDDGMCYVDTHYIPVEAGPGSEYTEVLSMYIDQINSSIVYPAGTYSVGGDIPCNVRSGGVAYLVLSARTTTGQRFIIRGNNNKINESFNVIGADIEYAPEQLTSSVYGIEVPLMLVKSAEAPTVPIQFKRETIQIPQSILSREDYGLGVNNGTEIYTNYIDFERQVYVKRCLSVDLEDQMTYLSISGTKINGTTLWQTIQCSHPGFTFDIYSDGPGSRTLYALRDGSTEGVSEYITQAANEGHPVKVFFGTNLTEEIDISAELAGIDNYIPVEAGGVIYFNNDRQEAVPSTIEYQSMMKKGEIEEL